MAIKVQLSEGYLQDEHGTPVTFSELGGVVALSSEDVQDMVGAFVVAGANMTITYDDPGNTLTFAVSGLTESVQDIVGAVLQGINGITVTYDDFNNTMTVSGTHAGFLGLAADDHTQYVRVDGTRNGPLLTNTLGGQALVDVTSTPGSARTLNLANFTAANWTLSAASLAVTITGFPASGKHCEIPMQFNQAHTGGVYNRALTWTNSINWLGLSAPVGFQSQDAVTLVTLWTDDGGTTIYGAYDPTDVRRPVEITYGNSTTALTIATGRAFFVVPEVINNWKLTVFEQYLLNANSISGTLVNHQLVNTTQASVNMLSTAATIDNNESSTLTAATRPVIDPTKNTVLTDDILRLDCAAIGSAPQTGVLTKMLFSPP